MTMLVATPQANTHSNTAAAAVDVSRATPPSQVLKAVPGVARPNTRLNTDARPTVTHWYDDPSALRGL